MRKHARAYVQALLFRVRGRCFLTRALPCRPAPEPGHRWRGVGWMGALRFAAFARQGRIYLYVYKSVMILWGTSDATITSRRYAMTGRMPMTDRGGQQTFHSSVNGLLYWKEWVCVRGMIERVREESEDQKGFAIHLSGLPLGRV